MQDARRSSQGSLGKLEVKSIAICLVENTSRNCDCSCMADSRDNVNKATSFGTPSSGLFSGKIFLTLVKEYLVFPSKSDNMDSSILNCCMK